MPIENSCDKYEGEIVFVLPIVGYGWSRRLPTMNRLDAGESIPHVESFNMRVRKFHFFLGEIRAGVGIVEQNDHSLNGQWVAFCIRDGMGSSTHDFSKSLASYNISIGNEEPEIVIDQVNLSMPEWMKFRNSPFLTGIGYISDSIISLEEIYQQKRQE